MWAPVGPRMGLTGAHLGMLLGKKTKRQENYNEAGVLVLTFLKKAEHSITLPGKNDTVTIKKKKGAFHLVHTHLGRGGVNPPIHFH